MSAAQLEINEPRQAEAYPRLDSLELVRAAANDRPICEYRRVDRRRAVGTVVIAGLAERSVAIEWWLRDQHIRSGQGKQEFALERVGMGPEAPRPFFHCPRCAQRRKVLWFKDGWACRRCQRLHYRKQLIPPLAVKRERFEHLHQAIGRGRPKGMHAKRYWSMRDELDRLGAALEHEAEPRYANEQHNMIVAAQWLPPEQAWDLLPDDWVVRDGKLTLRNPPQR